MEHILGINIERADARASERRLEGREITTPLATDLLNDRAMAKWEWSLPPESALCVSRGRDRRR